MGRTLVVAALAAVVIGGLVLVLIVVKLVRENARQREAAARPDVWPPAEPRPARRPAALMTQEYPAVEAQSGPQRMQGVEPFSGPMAVPGAVPPPAPPTGPQTGPQAVPQPGPQTGPQTGPQPMRVARAEQPSGPQRIPQPMSEPPSGPQPVPKAQKMQTPPPGWRPPVRSTRPHSTNGKTTSDD